MLCKLSSVIYYILGNIFKYDMYIFCLYNNDWFYLKLIFVFMFFKINFYMIMRKLCEIIILNLICLFLVRKLEIIRILKSGFVFWIKMIYFFVLLWILLVMGKKYLG